MQFTAQNALLLPPLNLSTSSEIHLGFKTRPFVPHHLIPVQGSPVHLLEFQTASRLKLLMFSGSKEKEPRYTCLSEAKGSLTDDVGHGFILCSTPPT